MFFWDLFIGDHIHMRLFHLRPHLFTLGCKCTRTLCKTLQRPKNSPYLEFGRERCTSEMLFRSSQKNYMLCVPAHFLYWGATIVSVQTEKWKIREEKLSYCVGQNNHRSKSNSVAFEKRNATVCEQNVWHLISRNVTVLADNVIPKKISQCLKWHIAIGPNNKNKFLAQIFRKKWRCGDFFIFTKYVVIWKYLANYGVK